MADYAAIVEAIDAAILSQAAYPLTVQLGTRQTTFRDLEQLMAARQYYARLISSAAAPGSRTVCEF